MAEFDLAALNALPKSGQALALAVVNGQLETLSAEQRVAWALEHLPGEFVLSSSFGIQAAVCLHLDEGRQCVLRDGDEIQLTAAEFRLLRYFMLHPQQILSKSHLAEHLYDGETERDSNVLEVHVNHLRRKLGRSVIETRRGQGYRFGASPA